MRRTKVEDVLLEMGMPSRIKGFSFIIDAMEIFDTRGTNIGITKELYPEIAKRNGTTWNCVERNIRHAFEQTRRKGQTKSVIDKYIGTMNCSNANSLKQLYMMLKRE